MAGHSVIRKVLVLIGLSASACNSKSGIALKDRLPGQYELFVGSNQPYSRHDFVKSTLLINQDGSYTLTCHYQAESSNSATSGRWHVYDSEKLGVEFENFKDCAGVWQWTTTSVNLIVEGDRNPQILLNPDINIFYERAKGK